MIKKSMRHREEEEEKLRKVGATSGASRHLFGSPHTRTKQRKAAQGEEQRKGEYHNIDGK